MNVQMEKGCLYPDQEAIRNDFLLLEALLFDFLNTFMRSIEVIHMNQSFIKHSGNRIDTTTPFNEETKIVEELSSFFKRPYFSTFIKTNFSKPTKIIDEMDECFKDLAKLIESVANALLMTTYCRLTNQNQTKIKQCFDVHLAFHEHLSQILDAWGRPSAGIYSSGPFFWLGAYDQCQSISNIMTLNQSVQYCRANIQIEAYGMQRHQIPLFYGMCLPVRCNERSVNDIFPIFSYFLEKTFGILISDNSTVECFKQKDSFFKKLGIPQWTVLAVLAFLGLLVLSGTSIDIYRKRRSRKYSVNKELSRSCSHTTTRLAPSIPSQMSSVYTPYAQDDACSFIYSDAPSQALTYKSAPAVRRTLKKSACVVNSIRAFSVCSTYLYLTRPCNRHLNSLYGIRVLSAFWVVIGHTHLFSLEYIGNVRQLWNLLKANENLSQIIFNSSLSVDSFLLISATVLAYRVHLRILQQKQRKSKCTALSPSGWLMLWFHRFMRLIPAYLITFLIIYLIFQHIGDGPMWSQQNGIFGARCDSNDIWRQLLFVSNFFPNECMPWMWYLALDTQFYMIAPIVLLLLHTVPTIAVALIVIVIISSIIYRATVMILFRFPATFVAALLENSGLATEEMEKMFRYLYAAPQARIGSFFIGILLGWLLSIKSKQTHSTIQIDIARFASFAMLSFSLFGANYANDFTIFSIFYAATFRVIWAFGLALFVWLCERGHMRMIYSFLAWDKWIVFSRLSYGFYLSHEPVLLYFIWTRRSAIIALSPSYFIIFAIEISVLSLFIASLIAFIIEIPPLMIERKIFKTIRARAVSNEANNEREQKDTEQKFNVRLYHQRKNDEIVELAPMISPMNRTKQWVEENQEDLKVASTRFHDPFCTMKSPTVMVSKTKQQFGNIGDDNDVIHQINTIMEKKCSNAQKVDTLLKQKQEIPMEQNHDKEISQMENVGFSWIEEARKRLDMEQKTHSQIPYNKERIMVQHSGVNRQKQHLDIHPLIIHVINGNRKSPNESYLDKLVNHKHKIHDIQQVIHQY
uniref:NRF domain-containing protein n=1 Tax=Wuchereria bancrofti TaxID=6293 RepID=A0A1I8EZ96_WUCBA